MSKSIHIRFDWAIKRLLRQKANFEILEGFLSELLREDILIEEILESESNQDSAFDKQNRVDILVKNSLGELMLIEVQNEREHDYFHRMLYGSSKLIAQFLSKGQPYSQVKKVFSINIVYFDLGHGRDYIYQGTTEFRGLHNGDTLSLSPRQKEKYGLQVPAQIFPTYYVLRLNCFDDVARDTLDEWIYFLKNSEIKDSFSAKGLQKAKSELREDSMSEAERWAYEAYVKEQRIRQSEIETAVFEMELELKQERAARERERQKNETVIRNLSKNLSVAAIAEITELEESYIRQVLGKL